MRVTCIKSNNLVTWDLRPSLYPMKSETTCKSKIQYRCGQLLRKSFPYDSILEDVSIPSTRLSLDFFMPQRRIAVEIQGLQHYKYNNFFHNKPGDLVKQQSRDNMKENFCLINNIDLWIVNGEEEINEKIQILKG